MPLFGGSPSQSTLRRLPNPFQWTCTTNVFFFKLIILSHKSEECPHPPLKNVLTESNKLENLFPKWKINSTTNANTLVEKTKKNKWKQTKLYRARSLLLPDVEKYVLPQLNFTKKNIA